MDREFLTQPETRSYLDNLSKNVTFDKQRLMDKFPHISSELVSLLSQMLEFNPHFRPTAADCIANPVFDKIRIPKIESKAEKSIHLDIDDDINFGADYNGSRDSEFDLKLVRFFKEKIIEEARKLKK